MRCLSPWLPQTSWIKPGTWPSWRKWSFWRDHENNRNISTSSIHPSHQLRLAIRRASSPLSSYPLPVARRIYAKWHLLLVLPETASETLQRQEGDMTLLRSNATSKKQASRHCMTWHGLTPRVTQWLTEFTPCSCNMLLSWYVQKTWSSSHNIILARFVPSIPINLGILPMQPMSNWYHFPLSGGG